MLKRRISTTMLLGLIIPLACKHPGRQPLDQAEMRQRAIAPARVKFLPGVYSWEVVATFFVNSFLEETAKGGGARLANKVLDIVFGGGGPSTVPAIDLDRMLREAFRDLLPAFKNIVADAFLQNQLKEAEIAFNAGQRTVRDYLDCKKQNETGQGSCKRENDLLTRADGELNTALARLESMGPVVAEQYAIMATSHLSVKRLLGESQAVKTRREMYKTHLALVLKQFRDAKPMQTFFQIQCNTENTSFGPFESCAPALRPEAEYLLPPGRRALTGFWFVWSCKDGLCITRQQSEAAIRDTLAPEYENIVYGDGDPALGRGYWGRIQDSMLSWDAL